VDVRLVEARERLGGRVLTIQDDHRNCDLGASWFWEGQPIIANLLEHFGLGYFEQYSTGAVLVEQADGTITKSPMQSPMQGSRRIEGGTSALVNAIVKEIPAEKYLTNHIVTGLSLVGDEIHVSLKTPTGEAKYQTKRVGLAIPLRLVHELDFSPGLPASTKQMLASTPTWMAGHAKFFAVYDTPFWREKGLCGTAISRRGPLAEIQDGSPDRGNLYSLFGFVGLTPEQRAVMGREQLIHLATAQLGAIFGEQALYPKDTYVQDWSAEDFTASTADRQPQTRQPYYAFSASVGQDWQDRLSLIVSETASANAGLLEGALSAGLTFAKEIANTGMSPLEDRDHEHKASMDWDWLIQ
jgi:monoamine oxidase